MKEPSLELEYPIEPKYWELYPPVKTGMENNVDLTGMRFNKWTVLGPDSYHKGCGLYWHCLCDCGTEKSVMQRNLLDGRSKSCGCYRKENIRKIRKSTKGRHKKYHSDLSGQRFGRWTVLSRIENEVVGRNPNYECRCDCGKMKIVSYASLKNGSSQSCGCLRNDLISRRYHFGEYYPEDAKERWKNHSDK